MDSTEQKTINGLVAFWSDSCFMRGKPVNRETRRVIKAKAGPQSWKVISSSPGEVQFYAQYADMPLQARRKWLDTIFYRTVAELALYIPALRLFFLALWHTTEGVKLVELREIFTQVVGTELSEVIEERITGQLGIDGVLKFKASTLDLQPVSIAGKNARLKRVLEERSIKEDEHKSYYEQDLSIGLWESSEGKHLDEFAKLLGSDPAEAAANLRRIFQEKDSQSIRDIILRILRKTIQDFPDVADAVRDRRAQSESKLSIIRDEPEINDDQPLFDNIPDKDEESIEERFERQEQIAEWRNKTQKFTTRELELYQSELSRLKADKTREEFYGGSNRAKRVTQQLKYLKSKYSS